MAHLAPFASPCLLRSDDMLHNVKELSGLAGGARDGAHGKGKEE